MPTNAAIRAAAPPVESDMPDAIYTQSRATSVERWARIALDDDWVAGWVEGAIFPTELVFFLATCEAAGIRYIIESGRQDGYSTRILGEFARRTGVLAASIDYEEDAERGRRCRARLAGYPIDLRIGSAFELLGTMIRQAPAGPIALLVDGPKGFSAVSVTAATAGDPRVAVISLHNLDPGAGYRRVLETVADGPIFYEEALGEIGDGWSALRRSEVAHCARIGTQRSLEHSTLGVIHVGETERRRLRRLSGTSFKFYQPPLVRLGWHLGLYHLTARLYTLSFRVFGS
jgi:hypothetical protein